MISTGICRWLFLLISLSTWTRLIDSKEMRVVCYYTNWSIYRPGQAKFSPQNINPYLCTHLIYAFGGFTKENTLKPFDKYQDIEKGGYAKFTGLKTYNKNLKTLIAIGGWNEGSSRFSPMVASADRRKELVKNAIKFLRQNHFDGLDLDWEYPSFRDGGKPRDRDNYAQLVKELREEFERESEKTGRPRLLLTMAVPAGIEYINKGYDVPKLTKYLDWMNILSYDYHSAYEPAVNHHAPLFSLEEENEYNYDTELNIDYTIKHYLKLGADPNKLVLGIPTYGRSYTLFNPDAYEIGSPADGPGDMGEYTRENGYLAYYEICEYIKDQDWEVEEPNSDAMGPIAFKGNQWVGYDDENIVRKKAEYVVENKMGGIMFWAIDNDDFRGNCHGKPYPLIEAAKEAMLNAYGITDENLISPPSKPTKRPKPKSKTRTSKTTTTTTEQPDDENSVKPSRRRRIKTKSQSEDRPSSSSQSKRRKSTSRKTKEETSTYSSLKIVTPAYTTPEPPATPDMGGGFKCEDEGFFPNPKDCKKYYWCLNGAGDSGIVAHQFTCPAGLYFNKAADSCDYSQNVLCNKKLQKVTTAAPKDKETTTKTSTTESSVTTTRVPATSKSAFNFRTTTTTTEAYEDDEYEYEDDEDTPNKKEEPEEDPKVIKELFDLIRKAGGIEELEKQLKLNEGKVSSSSDATTPSALSKTISRVLSKTSKNTLNAFKRTSINRNSGGPQGSEEIVKKDDKRVDRGRLQYKTLTRQRPATEKAAPEEEDDDDEEEEEEAKTKPKERKSFRSKSSLEYVNIRRPKASTTTEATEEEDTFKRNKILGETADSEPEIPEDPTTQKSGFPQYVNIRRQRPTTAQPDSDDSSKYVSIRRTTVSSINPEDAENDDEQKYQVIRRGTTTSEPNVNEENDENRGRSTTSSPTPLVEISGTVDSKYSTIRRSTTPSAVEDGSENIKNEAVSIGSTIADQSTSVGPSSPSTTKTDSDQPSSAPSDHVTETDLPDDAQTLTTLNAITESIVTSTRALTESNSASSITPKIDQEQPKKKRPALYQPRPFSFGSASTSKPVEPTSTTTTASKVSQSFKFRVRPTSSSSTSTSPTTTTTVRPARTRTRYNKLVNEEQEEAKYQENKPVRSRKRIVTTSEAPIDFNEEYNRKYRPVELADLSSLTAVDLRGGFVSKNKRRRPVTSASTTSEKPLEESDKTGPRTITLARKATFGKGRRVVEDQVNDQTSTRKVVTIPKEVVTTTKRPRKIIRKFRPPSSTTISSLEDISLNSVETSSAAPTRKRIPIFRQRSTTERAAVLKPRLDQSIKQTDEDLGDGEEDENIKLSESNIRESSHINTFGFDEKPGKYRFGKSKDVKPEDEELITVQPSTESARILRTRKIIRKLTTATTPSSSKEEVKSRKRIFRGRTTAIQSLSDSLQDDKDAIAKKAYRVNKGTTEEPVISSISGLRLSLYTRHTTTTTTASPVQESEEEDEDEYFDDNDDDDEEDDITTDAAFSAEKTSTPKTEAPVSSTTSTSSPINEEEEAEEDDEDNNTTTEDEYNFSAKKTFRTTEEPPRLNLYSRRTTTSPPEEEENENTTTDAPKYTIYTSSVGRTHQFESNVNFSNEDDTKTMNSSVSMSALNTRNESEIVMNDDKVTTTTDSPVVTTLTVEEETTTDLPASKEVTTTKAPLEITTEYQRRSTLRSIKGRPRFGFTRKASTESTESKVEASTKRAFSRKFGKKPAVEVTRRSFGARSTTPLPLNKLLYKYSSTQRTLYTPDHEEEEEEEEEEDGDNEEVPAAETTTPRLANKPVDSRTFKAKSTTTPIPKNLNDLDVDTEAIKTRNKNLFSKRKMNTPALPTYTEEATVQTESTEPALTTLHHVFADISDTETATEPMGSSTSNPESSSKIERLIEVNRIVQVQSKDQVEVPTSVDKIGEISRVTLIKIVDGNNETIIKDPGFNEIGDFNVKVQREERKYEIFGDSKVANSKDLTNPAGKPEIIDGISHINVITPKPLLVTEASTISLQGLFQTEKPHLNPSFTTNDEVLEAGLSEFVNVRVLNQNPAHTNKILNPDEEESTIKAHVVEISPKPDSRTIKIVPIQVAMARSVRV